MSKTYQISGLCKGCGVWAKFTGRIDEMPACPRCGHREDPEKLAKARAAMEAFEADPVKQAAIREIQAKVDRGEDPFPELTQVAHRGNGVYEEDDGDAD